MLENKIEVFLKDKMCINVKNLYEKISSFSSSEQCVIYNFIKKCITQINSMQNNINANKLDFHEHPIVKEITNFYNNLIDNIKEVKFFEQDLSCTTPWFYDTVVEDREELQKFLKENNIGTRVMYGPINKQVAYNIVGEHEVSNMIGQKGLWLPSTTQLTDDEIKYICSKIVEFYN